MSITHCFICILLCLSTTMESQITPGIKLSYGHYGSEEPLKWTYNNLANVRYKRTIEVHQYNFPADLKLQVGPITRFGVRYAYGRYTAREKNTQFLPEENTTHSFGIHCDLILNTDGAFQVFLSPGLGIMKVKSDELNPFYVEYETPYRIHTRWKGNYVNFDLGVFYTIPNSHFNIEGLLGLRFGELKLDEMTFGSREVDKSNYNGKITSYGGLFEIGLCYMFNPIADKISGE